MARKRLTRKEIQQDQIRSWLVDVYEWLTQNSKFLIAGLAGLALLFVATYAWEQYSESRDSDAQLAFSEAREILNAPLTTDDVPTGEDAPEFEFQTEEERNRKALEAFRGIADDYSGTTMGDMSLYYSAICLNNLGEKEEAEATLRRLITETDQPEYRNLGRSLLASSLQEQRRTDEVMTLWQAILDDPSTRFPKSLAILRLGQAHDSAGDTEAALERYKSLRAEFPESQELRQIQDRLDYLEARTRALQVDEEPAPESESETEEDPAS